MKQLLMPAAIAAICLLSCKNETEKGKFTVNGELKGAADQKVYIEELSFGEKGPMVLDTAEIKNGRFSIGTVGTEEGMYRLRLEKGNASYIFINDKSTIGFTGNSTEPKDWNFNSAANISLKRLMIYTDSAQSATSTTYADIDDLKKAGAKEADSALVALTTTFNAQEEAITKYCFQYADTAISPIVAIFAATMAPVELDRFLLPMEKLGTRFSKHKGIANAINYIKTAIAKKDQTAAQQQGPASHAAAVGSLAPNLTMNDVNGKPFSLSQLRGKYVLVDFWASWCGPCRGENPNVVAAYNKFKDKNFIVLGVSLDDNKANWIKAIADDKLTWTHISDLKKWESEAIGLYGIDGIPYNVLIDPQGKIIATGLREGALHSKLAEVIK